MKSSLMTTVLSSSSLEVTKSGYASSAAWDVSFVGAKMVASPEPLMVSRRFAPVTYSVNEDS